MFWADEEKHQGWNKQNRAVLVNEQMTPASHVELMRFNRPSAEINFNQLLAGDLLLAFKKQRERIKYREPFHICEGTLKDWINPWLKWEKVFKGQP